jgi:CDP-paratose 2-epimerase
MTTSIATPDLDFRTNTIGSFNVLEAVRKYSPNSHAIFSSTNKVYGDLKEVEIIETDTRYIAPGYGSGFGTDDINLNFQSPYGCSKGAADQYFLDYHRIYNLNTTVFRHSSMYGGRQFSTTDQGWIGWFISEAIKFQKGYINEIEIAGNGKQVRDLLYISDMVDLYYTALGSEVVFGKAYNVGGGNENSMSIIELFQFLSEKMNVDFRYKFNENRISDQKIFISNNFALKRELNWLPKVSKEQGLEKMIDWVAKNL